MVTELWRIDAPHWRAKPCFGLIVADGVVTQAALMGKWAVGQPSGRALRWFYERGAAVERVRPLPVRRWKR